MTITTSHVFDLADYMRKAIRESGLTVQEVAEQLEMSRESVSLWINGRRMPTRGQRIAFAQVTGVTLEWLEQGMARPERLELPTFWSVADLDTEAAFWAIVEPCHA